MAAALDHPNIIPIYRVGQAAGTYYFAMKFVEGRAGSRLMELREEQALREITQEIILAGLGRTDFFPGRAEEVAGLLYDSIFKKLLPLGDHVLLYPAHGAGSVCGSNMASRNFSTLGYERRNNRMLQLDRDAFVARKVKEHHYKPPYFKTMELYNLKGAPPLERLPAPQPCSVAEFVTCMDAGAQVVDVRSPEAVAGAFIPGSLALPLDMIPAFAGYFLDYNKPIALVLTTGDRIEGRIVRETPEAITILGKGGVGTFPGSLVSKVEEPKPKAEETYKPQPPALKYEALPPMPYASIRGMKVFHRATCTLLQHQPKTKIVEYSTRQEAIDDGLKPCGTCNP
jgi:hypothetical protein